MVGALGLPWFTSQETTWETSRICRSNFQATRDGHFLGAWHCASRSEIGTFDCIGLKLGLPSGEHTKSCWKWPLKYGFSMIFPLKNGGSFHCYLAVHQRVNMLKQHIPYWGCQNLGVRYHSQTHVLSRYFQQPSAGNPLVEQSYDPFVAGKNRWF